MATFYIQLENKLLQISGDLTNENISKALGYVPVSPNVTNELSQRVDNITFDSLKDNPFLQDGSGELNIVDEAGNIIAKIDADGIHSVDFIAGEHRLSDKTDKTYVDEAIKNVEVDLTGYATEEYVNNIDFYNIKDNPIANGEENSLTLVDENGNIGLKVSEDGLYVKDVIADGHTLSQKADKSDIPSLDGYATESYVNTNLQNYATKDEVSDLVDMSVVTELQGKVETLVGEDVDKSVRDIAVDVLTETLVSETATEAYDTLAEMSAWIKSHPEDASAMNTAIQKNATDITNLDVAYKAADAKVLTDAQEYTDNINFYTIKDNPIVDNNDGNLTFVDENGYIGLQLEEDRLYVKDVIAGEHILSNKADKTYIDNLELDELNAILVDTDSVADDPIVSDYITENELETALKDKQDKLVDGVNIATINGQSLTGGGDLAIESGAQSMVSTTWAELKDMRDSASLVVGTWYRITDYVTTTSQTNTMSAGHPFDMVVLATGENTLSEEARAVRHEGDISMSVSILGMKFFYKGVLIVDGVEWFEFENPEGSLVTSSATPAIGDIVYPYFDGTIVTDEVFPIESVGESENEYFLNNKANLDAWKIWYCLDNDKKRFPWVVAKTKKSIVVTLDEATLLTAEYNGTYEYEGIMYYRWDTVYSGMNVSFLTISDNPKAGDTTSVYGIIEMDMFIPADIPIIGVNEPSENEGFGVIYRMIDERSNDCPYDFKNIQFLVPITHGQFSENGTEEWVFTFNLNSGDGSASTDYSNTSYCFNNIIKSALLGLNFNIFLNNAVMTQCYNNTLGNGCMHNVFNDGCYNNTLGNECMYNLFERYTCRCNVSPNVQSETIANNFGYTTEARVAYDSSNTLKIYCEADDIDYNDLRNKPTIPTIPTIDTSMSSSSTNAVQNKVVKSYVDSVCNIPIETTTSSAKSLTANIYYKWTNTPTSITITLTTPTNANILNNYMFEFTASSSGCTLSVPSSIKWLNEIPPVIEPGKTYQISIINNLATVAKFG